MPDEILRNDSTENGKKIWKAVEKAASRAPEWVKKQIQDLEGGEGADGSENKGEPKL
jgi:hypothetical protein